MPCSACGGGGSSASSQFSLGIDGDFKPLQARQPPKMIYVTPARAAALRAYYAQIAQAQGRRTLRFA